MQLKRVGAFALILIAVLLRLYLFLSIHYTTDDALITFRYAENVAAGTGFVYNAAEKVLGTTTFLNTLLIALLVKFGITSFTAAFLLGLCADCISGWILLRLFSDLPPAVSWLPAFVFLFNPETLQWSLSGMETPVAIAWMFAAVFFSSRERWGWAFFFGALSVLTRIDGIAVLVGLMACHVLRHGNLPAKPLALAALLLLPWILFGFMYFGSPLPNSATAKWALSEEAGERSAIAILIRGFLHLHTFGAVLLIPALVGTWSILREKRSLLLLPVWTWGYALSYTLAAGPMHPWYYTPFYAGYLPLVFSGVARIIKSRTVLWYPIASVAVLLIVYMSYDRTAHLRRDQAHYEAVNKAAGMWARNNTPGDAVLAVKDIGYLGYYSQRRILDLAGLISPQCISYRAKGDFLGCIRASRPDYFAFSKGQIRNLKIQQSDLLKDFEQVHSVESTQGAYVIFQRKSSNPDGH